MQPSLLLLIFLALAIGLWLKYALANFAERLNRTLRQQYQDCYLPHTQQPLAADYHWLLPIKSRVLNRLPPIFVGLSLLMSWFSSDFLTQMWLLALLGLLTAIGVLDFYYRLISTALCQALALLALFGAWQQIGLVSLEQSVQSLLSAAVVSGLFFQISHWIYRKEVFGEGDCWLISALAMFYPWQQLPLLLLFASVLTLLAALFVGRRRADWKTQQLPFAPALNISAIVLFLL
ncbi:prepilin peptidase [Testudinibacter sp. TR-2022]|uniref:prepilin peptidase n=1 Tax=Testudinibacter sp. TR-2022 TaxID=2585029 RepID=UPI001117E9BD|nr:A24 family peptidase [Testudinibacter sp. TR-2022]TNH05462.1 prepilin peptidase [Pasteurellaceae bacterium Phil31]TNH07163.1 prepilin peptidase [Testudinibacter sp. TR-2022]TNH11139.1 prepilin peptidase [Testudinibacter sp. TR-2022]TNH13360.1 prepilin peptidase [Testudinibacter sp. TR-2022]TNH16323.1 prepilin peptidase [Testudinibacter sp. TR-2022]